MASSKLWFSLLGSSIIRTSLSKTSNLTYPIPTNISQNSGLFLRFVRSRCSSSAAVAEPAAAGLHPWPEWVTFVDHLKTQGYFSKPIIDSDQLHKDSVSYIEYKALKDPCLTFARLRFDLIKLLPVEDVEALVEKGCPNLFRKVVNSSKRLRSHLHLDEAEVCGACNLCQSCDRAYVVLADDEASARTVDVIRLLLIYALDPSVLSGGTVSSDRAIIEKSARRLLSELIELSDAVPAPEIDLSSVQPKRDPTPRSKEDHLKFNNGDKSQSVRLRNGDWICSRCNFLNYAKNLRCLKCKGEDCPKRIDCSSEMKKGDWNCPGCGLMNFAKNSSCFRCKGPRPPRHLQSGEWECPTCDYLNYRRNAACKKCNRDRPSFGNVLFDESHHQRN